MRVSQSQAELQENDRMNIIGQNGNDGLHYDTGSLKLQKKIYITKKRKKNRRQNHAVADIGFK